MSAEEDEQTRMLGEQEMEAVPDLHGADGERRRGSWMRLAQGGALLAAIVLLITLIAYSGGPNSSELTTSTHNTPTQSAQLISTSEKHHGHDTDGKHRHQHKKHEHKHKSHEKHEKGHKSSHHHEKDAKQRHASSSSSDESSPLKVKTHPLPVGNLSVDESAKGTKDDKNATSIINADQDCSGPYPGYPYCQDHVDWMARNWNANPEQEAYYRSRGVDGSKCSFLNFLNLNGFFCPEAADFTKKQKIRGVNLGGWLVLEPWITPSLFKQFDPKENVQDQWTFCEHLGPKECRKQLESHWDSFVSERDLDILAGAGINHVRIPVGYWIFGDIRADEPWVSGELPYLERVLEWCKARNLHVVLDLHCAPGSQNGFDNSGRKGEIHFADEIKTRDGRPEYPNIRRALEFISNLTAHFSTSQHRDTVVGIELVNEAFVTIPIEVVKDYYLQGYEIVKAQADHMAVIIGDSFRFGAWNDFMFPPHYRHVWIDTHIYQVFDAYRLSMTWQQHMSQTCTINKPEVAVAPLSTMVGEWSLATTDCALWLNGCNTGSRYDGTFAVPGQKANAPIGSCEGQHDLKNTTVWTPEYRQFLTEFASKQMDAYESGSSSGWFFWNFKTEQAPQWDYIMGVQEGWIPKDLDNRPYKC